MNERGILSLDNILKIGEDELSGLIKPSGYFRQKAKKIKLVCEYFYKKGVHDIEKANIDDAEKFREELLNIWGIGPETCDSILLYAFDVCKFVVDAYTKRFVNFYGLPVNDLNYDAIQRFFENNLKKDAYLYNEYHALIVRWGKDFNQYQRKRK